jgi:hypothetical protein
MAVLRMNREVFSLIDQCRQLGAGDFAHNTFSGDPNQGTQSIG